MNGGDIHVLTSLFAMATLILTSGALGSVLSQFFDQHSHNLATELLTLIGAGYKGEITACQVCLE